jgi:hypothetical protein
MDKICIAKKVSVDNIQFLDFAVDDNEKLLVFPGFKEASQFLKNEVGTGEALLDFIITTVEAQKDNPRMKEILQRGEASTKVSAEPANQFSQVPPPGLKSDTKTNEVECYFLLNCSDYEVVNNDSIIDKTTGKQLIPVLAFVDAAKTDELVKVPNFQMLSSFIGEVEDNR